MIEIDGSLGEGGGEILRSALTLSLVTQSPLRLFNIRARRSRPGLQPQHLQAVKAAVQVGEAKFSGAEIGSGEILFEPRAIRAGTIDFDIGTAGSAPLVLQTILVPLSLAGEESRISITGGTHIRWSPCFHYLDLNWRPFMERAGFDFEITMERAGFYPRGGGLIHTFIRPVNKIHPLQALKRGSLLSVDGISAIANLDIRIAQRQRDQALDRLKGLGCNAEIEITRLEAPSPGTLLLLLARYEHSQCCFFSLGERGKPAEQVADEAVDQLEFFATTNGAVDHYLADQLILPLALAEGKSQLRTSMITSHLLTNSEVVQRFLPVNIKFCGKPGAPGVIEITGCGIAAG